MNSSVHKQPYNRAGMMARLCSMMLVMTWLSSARAHISHQSSTSSNTTTRSFVQQIEASDYVLPKSSLPISYDLFLDLTDDQFRAYSGTVDVSFRQRANSSVFAINSAGLSINEGTLRMVRSDMSLLPIAGYEIKPELQIVLVHLSEQLITDEVYTAHLEFRGEIHVDFFKGLYRSSYQTENGEKYIATTFFAATYARTVFPCYDEPEYKASFLVKIRHGAKYTALSNMPESQRDEKAAFVETTFRPTPPMSTYLLAFVVSELKTVSSQDELFRVYAPEGREQQTAYAHSIAIRALRALENYFGRQNQMPKIDLAAIPDFAMGAMENWGLITFRKDYLLYQPGETTAQAQQSIAAVITHELAHMWFGNEVTPEWWTYVWLNEGFARYFEYYITSELEPSWSLWEQFIVTNVHSALAQDCHSNNRPMSYYSTEPSIVNELYDYVVYAKSASVIRMIQNVIGFDTFRPALNDYLRSRSYLTTNPRYLYESIEKFRTVDLPASVEKIFESWANAPGYPLVTVTIDWNQRTLKATQKRFWMPNDHDIAPKNELFYVPLNYGFNGMSAEEKENTAPSLWLTPDQPEVSVNIDAGVDVIFMNKQQTGYYRVNYDKESWNQLIKTLNDDKFDEHIPVINRAQLVDDVANLARAGIVDYSVALSLMQYLERETEYIPWSTAYNALLHLDRLFSSNSEYERFESFGRNLTTRVYHETQLQGKLDHLSQLHRERSLYLACYFGVMACLADTDRVLQVAIGNDSLYIPKDLQSTVFCAFNKHKTVSGTQFEVELFSKFFQQPTEYRELVDSFILSLGCSHDVAVIRFYLDMVHMDGPGLPIPNSLRNHILVSLIKGGPTTRQLALEYISRNYRSLSEILQERQLLSLFEAMGANINSRVEYDMLVRLKDTNKGLMSVAVADAVQRAISYADETLDWLDKHSIVISKWLVSQNYGSAALPDDNGANIIVQSGVIAAMAFLCVVIRHVF